MSDGGEDERALAVQVFRAAREQVEQAAATLRASEEWLVELGIDLADDVRPAA